MGAGGSGTQAGPTKVPWPVDHFLDFFVSWSFQNILYTYSISSINGSAPGPRPREAAAV